MKSPFLPRALGALTAAALLALAGAPVQAADEPYPSRAIRVLVGFAAGGGSDTTVRVMAPALTKLLNQNIVIDNRPGAGGNLASEALVKAAPDGYTIMLGTIGSLAVNPHLNKLAYDPLTDMEPISLAVSFANVLVVNAKSKVQTFAEYVQTAKAPGTDLAFGSSGIGSAGHLSGELLKSMAGLSSQHIAYRGGAPAMNDLLGGTLPSIFSAPPEAVPHIAAGTLRALAVTSLTRMDVLPNVPTVAESGFPGFEANNWYAYAAPAGTPKAVIDTLNKAIVAALKDPEVSQKLKERGLGPAPGTPKEAGDYIRAESKKWGDLVRKIGISAH
jgi:tripartite-type tricarboxylate transporter receptor subunit TctC